MLTLALIVPLMVVAMHFYWNDQAKNLSLMVMFMPLRVYRETAVALLDRNLRRLHNHGGIGIIVINVNR
jgi:hypothetical protein